MPAVKVERLTKEYRIGAARRDDTLKDALASALRDPLRWLGGGERGREEHFLALRDVCFKVEPGEVVGIIGNNGAGKSTLLKILSRITEPTRGRAELRGRVLSLLDVGTGFHPDLTGRENVFLNGAILGMGREEIRRKFDAIVAFSGIEKFIDTPVKRYSSGMYVRLAFAVAAHFDPEILIVDEVLAVGDAAFQKKCLGRMEDVGREGRTLLFVSHNMGAVKQLCSRAVVLREGAVVHDGDILAGVAAYYGRDPEETTWYRWNPDRAPSMPEGRLLAAGILQGGKPAGADVLTEDSLEFCIRFEVLREAKVGTSVILYNADGDNVFASISNHEPNWHGRVRPPGIYRSVCTVPANFLAEGSYKVSITFWEGTYKHGLVEKDLLSFHAHHRGYVRGDLPYEIRNVTVMPLFSWRSEREG